MPEVQFSNAGKAVIDYITCTIRSNRPRIHHAVCEAACPSREDCRAYEEWFKLANGKEMGADKSKKIRRRRKTL